ncbi:cell division protein ZapA [Psychrobacter immobilis]|uniref:cell division protein ZapA n=1 Tax=Psychrobacter TaxID=497 RepID=UPI001919F7E5|nr:cell division protein ZapA [Psychrobacter immobilis]
MTDDQTNPLNKQAPNNPSKNNQLPTNGLKSQRIAPNTSAANTSAPQSGAAKPAPKTNSTPEPQIKKVDIAIAGVTYPIYCPVHEQEELHSAVSYINNYALDLKRDAPSLSQESLLVLCCLNLYEKIHTYQRSDEDRIQGDKQSEALLNKIMKDAHSIL